MTIVIPEEQARALVAYLSRLLDRPRPAVPLCEHHAAVVHGLRTAHGSEDGWQDRVAAIARACRACLEVAR